MPLPRLRAIIEYSVYDGENYHTMQICRPNFSKPIVNHQELKSNNDYSFYVFSRFPLDGFELTEASFEQFIPFINYFRSANGELKEIQDKYYKQTIRFEEFVGEKSIDLDRSQTPPKQYYPAYEPIISIIEVDPAKDGETPKDVLKDVILSERERAGEYLTMLRSLGYDPKEDNVKWENHQIQQWLIRNAKVYRLVNPVANNNLAIGDIKYCEPGKHYWHFISDSHYIRKFYVDRQEIKSHSLADLINSIPKEDCPDALEHRVAREGKSIAI